MQQTIMRRVVWLDSAINDLIRLKEFLTENNHEAAKKAAEKIKKIISQLIETPSIGKPVKDLLSYSCASANCLPENAIPIFRIFF